MFDGKKNGCPFFFDAHPSNTTGKYSRLLYDKMTSEILQEHEHVRDQMRNIRKANQSITRRSFKTIIIILILLEERTKQLRHT